MTKALLLLMVLTGTVSAQQPAAQPVAQLSAVTYTAYSARTELFAEWRPFVVGQATRLTAHLTHTGERFRAFEEGKVTLTFTVGDVKVSAIADEASMNESDGCASGSLDRIVCNNQRGSAKDDSDYDDNDEPHERVARHEGASRSRSRGWLLIE